MVTNGGRANVFVLKHASAQLNLIGSTDVFDENGEIIKDFVYNSTDLTQNTVQLHHGKVYAWVYDGGVYVENIASLTGEELVYAEEDNGNTDASVENLYEFVNCSIKSNSVSVGLQGKGSAKKTVKMTNVYANKVFAYSLRTGSEFTNCTFGYFEMDCWELSGETAVLNNCTITDSITTYSGRTHLILIDCNFDISKLSLGSDGGGKCYALVYTSADCENSGTLNIYRNGNGSTPVTDDSKYPYTMVEEYANNNPAIGHAYSHSFEWAEGNKYAGICTVTHICDRCSASENEEIAPMITKKGFSVPLFGTTRSVLIGFELNFDAIERYEELSKASLKYGIVVAVRENLGDGNAPLDENGNPVELEKGMVIKFDATEYDVFSIIAFKVNLKSEHFDTELLMTGYIEEIAENGDISISYVQESFITENNFSYTSYTQQSQNAVQ